MFYVEGVDATKQYHSGNSSEGGMKHLLHQITSSTESINMFYLATVINIRSREGIDVAKKM